MQQMYDKKLLDREHELERFRVDLGISREETSKQRDEVISLRNQVGDLNGKIEKKALKVKKLEDSISELEKKAGAHSEQAKKLQD